MPGPVSETVGGNKEAGSDLTRRGDTGGGGERGLELLAYVTKYRGVEVKAPIAVIPGRAVSKVSRCLSIEVKTCNSVIPDKTVTRCLGIDVSK